jgi:anti-sigma factor (TIGR02949 family)
VSRPEDPQTHQGHDDIGCLETIETFYAYLDGEMSDPQSIADFERHMAHCRSCFTRAELEGLLNERLAKLAKHRAPERLKNRLRGLMDRF